jgi:hypothetical protein
MRKSGEKVKNLLQILDKLEYDLCYKLDEILYFPMKEELKNKGTHSLGFKKEDYKVEIVRLIEEVKKQVSK